MKDLRNLTNTEANKIECLLLTLTESVKENIRCYKKLMNDDYFDEKTKATFRSNYEWFIECYELIYETKYED